MLDFSGLIYQDGKVAGYRAVSPNQSYEKLVEYAALILKSFANIEFTITDLTGVFVNDGEKTTVNGQIENGTVTFEDNYPYLPQDFTYIEFYF